VCTILFFQCVITRAGASIDVRGNDEKNNNFWGFFGLKKKKKKEKNNNPFQGFFQEDGRCRGRAFVLASSPQQPRGGFWGEPGVGAARGHPLARPRGGVAANAAPGVARVGGLPWKGRGLSVRECVCERFVCVSVRV